MSDGVVISDNVFLNVFFYSTILLDIVLGIYTIVFGIVGLSQVQQFGYGKAILNLLLPGIIILIPFLLLFLVMDTF